MGLLDWLFPSAEQKIATHIRTLTDRDSQPEDREASAHALVATGEPQALLGLLSRFDVQLENQMKDASEKDHVQALALSVGGASMKEPLEAWLKRCRVFARPLSMYEDFYGRTEAITIALSVLEVEFIKDDLNKPQKKREMLIWLADNQDDRLLDEALKFLEDFDEGVRYAAGEVIIAQEDDRGRLPLLERFAHTDEDSNRVKTRWAEIFISRRWSVKEHEEALAQRPPHGYTVANGLIQKS